MRKPKVGETLFLVDISDRYTSYQKDCVVSKVGRKYFYVKRDRDSWNEIPFYIADWTQKTDYNVNYSIYENRQEWEDMKEAAQYEELIYKAFSGYGGTGFTLNQLRKVAIILGIKLT